MKRFWSSKAEGTFIKTGKYNEEKTMTITWEDCSEIKVTITGGEAVISANKEGLLSLARHLTVLAESAPGSHIHYDEYNSLEEGSAGLIIEKSL